MGERMMSEEDVRRKVSKTVLHASERGKRSLFELLTAKNAEKINRILAEKPLLHENRADAATHILLDPAISDAMPQAFFDDPTAWIESQPNIDRAAEGTLPSGETINELWEKPYDVSKVKAFTIGTGTKKRDVVSKRLAPHETAEVARTLQAAAAGIPTARVLGEVSHQGNTYALYEKLNGRNLNDLFESKKLNEALFWFGNTSISHKLEAFDASLKKWGDAAHHTFTPEESEQLRSILETPELARAETIGVLCSYLRDSFEIGFKHRWTNVEQQSAGAEQEWRRQMFYLEDLVARLGEDGLAELKSSGIDLIRIIKDLDRVSHHKLNMQSFMKKYKGFIQRCDEVRDAQFQITTSKVRQFEREFVRMVTGFDVVGQIEALEEQCKKAGIEHKDFEKRNMVVTRDADGNQKLILIDWTPPMKKSGRKSSSE